MNVRYYMDMHIHGDATAELRRRGIDVLTAQEDGRHTASDPTLLDRATSLGRVFVTFDHHLLADAKRRQLQGIEFAGVAYSKPLRITVGQLIEQLMFLHDAGDAEYMMNRVEWLPI